MAKNRKSIAENIQTQEDIGKYVFNVTRTLHGILGKSQLDLLNTENTFLNFFKYRSYPIKLPVTNLPIRFCSLNRKIINYLILHYFCGILSLLKLTKFQQVKYS